MREYLLVFVVAAVITYASTPFVRWLAFATGAITAVRDRDIHTHPIPRLGGAAMLLGRVAALEDLGQVGQPPGYQQRGDEPEHHPHPAKPRDRMGVDIAAAHRRDRPGREGKPPHERRGGIGDDCGHHKDQEVFPHGSAPSSRTKESVNQLLERGYAGKAPTRSVTSARISLDLGWSGSPSVWVTAWAMRSAMTFISSVPMPWVVTEGVPTRMPEAVFGGCGSKGMAFLLSTMPAASARASAARLRMISKLVGREMAVPAAVIKFGGSARARCDAWVPLMAAVSLQQ